MERHCYMNEAHALARQWLKRVFWGHTVSGIGIFATVWYRKFQNSSISRAMCVCTHVHLPFASLWGSFLLSSATVCADWSHNYIWRATLDQPKSCFLYLAEVHQGAYKTARDLRLVATPLNLAFCSSLFLKPGGLLIKLSFLSVLGEQGQLQNITYKWGVLQTA